MVVVVVGAYRQRGKSFSPCVAPPLARYVPRRDGISVLMDPAPKSNVLLRSVPYFSSFSSLVLANTVESRLFLRQFIVSTVVFVKALKRSICGFPLLHKGYICKGYKYNAPNICQGRFALFSDNVALTLLDSFFGATAAAVSVSRRAQSGLWCRTSGPRTSRACCGRLGRRTPTNGPPSGRYTR